MQINSVKTIAVALLIGAISQSQAVLPLVDATSERTDAHLNTLFAQADTDQDGFIQKSECEAIWKKHAKRDANKDKALSKEELGGLFISALKAPGKALNNVCYKETETGKVYLDIFLPSQKNANRPVVFFTHGGGWAAGSKLKSGQAIFKSVHEALLQQGFAVVSIGYRLVKKDGQTGMRDCVVDCKDAVRFISAHSKALGIDPQRVYTFGDSAGGHLAQMLLLSSPELQQGDAALADYTYTTVAGVSWYGPSDFQNIQLFNHNDRPDFRDRFGARIMAGGVPASEKEARYKEMSPVTYLTKDSPPLLLIQGDKDTTIPVKHAYLMQETIKTIPAPVEILIVKNAGHNWRSVDAPISPTRDEIVKRTVDYFLQHKAQ